MHGPTRGSPAAVAAAVAAVGAVITIVLTWATVAAYDQNEDSLVAERVDQGAAVLMAAVPSIDLPLAATARLAEGSLGGSPEEVLQATLGSQVGPDLRFQSASIWRAGDPAPLGELGAPAALAGDPDQLQAFFTRAVADGGLVVRFETNGDVPRLGYAYAGADTPGGPLVVYAEQELPGDRTDVPRTDDAFAEVDYAIYLGTERDPDLLLAASAAHLPLRGRVAEASVPIGDENLLLVMRSRGDLGGTLLPRLPWVSALSGTAITLGAAVLSHRLQRRRRAAEALATENAHLYAAQRQASVELQQSLLPGQLPTVAGVEIVARYSAGVAGTEVGGDWYDALPQGDRLVAVVGDVSGRGLAAVSVMASVRHVTRALAAHEDEPAQVLTKVAEVVQGEGQGHFVTLACGALDIAGHRLTVAAAGHPPPLLVADGEASFVEVPVGPPVGSALAATYGAVTVPVPPGATVLFFTDGLFERRGEPIDVGLERLRSSAAGRTGPLGSVVDGIVEDLTHGEAADDLAVLAIRWAQ